MNPAAFFSSAAAAVLTLHLSCCFYFLIIIIPPRGAAGALSFNFSGGFSRNPECSQAQNTGCINYLGDTFFNLNSIMLTKNQIGAEITNSSGQAVYAGPVDLWDPETGEVTDFTTHFSFIMDSINQTLYGAGDGLAFFLSPYPPAIPAGSGGGYLALYNDSSSAATATVAVEFDSYMNVGVDPSSDHVGIDVNSIKSVATVNWTSSIKDGRTGSVWIDYNATTGNLSVFLTYAKNPVFTPGSYNLTHHVNLSRIMPPRAAVGFAAATGRAVETHNILSWQFSSTLVVGGKKRSNKIVLAGLVVAGVLMFAGGLFWFVVWKRRSRREEGIRREGENKKEDEEDDTDMDEDDELEKAGWGPKRFPYDKLAAATGNFREEGKLGEGGFGAVYQGHLDSTEVAIKRISKGSKQGRKEYASEVKIISRLRHRNLVQLVGWCHDDGDLLLVYELMPNGSLDRYLYRKTKTAPAPPQLDWPTRKKIAMGVASALLYLHEEWEQCVVHRDLKPSNVMLDSGFNAKLGDFGLARLLDHGVDPQTTILAGTMGYLAPECVITGKASPESDVYSFGVVVLEICCSRRPIEAREEPGKVRLLEHAWGLYGKGEILDAADAMLVVVEDEDDDDVRRRRKQIERMMVVGLWCAHPDPASRPTIRQAIAVLGSDESPLPVLPAKMPVPTFYAPPTTMSAAFNFPFTGATASSSWTGTGSSAGTELSLLSAASQRNAGDTAAYSSRSGAGVSAPSSSSTTDEHGGRFHNPIMSR